MLCTVTYGTNSCPGAAAGFFLWTPRLLSNAAPLFELCCFRRRSDKVPCQGVPFRGLAEEPPDTHAGGRSDVELGGVGFCAAAGFFTGLAAERAAGFFINFATMSAANAGAGNATPHANR